MDNKDFNLESEYLVRVMVLPLLPVFISSFPILLTRRSQTTSETKFNQNQNKPALFETFHIEESFINIIRWENELLKDREPRRESLMSL